MPLESHIERTCVDVALRAGCRLVKNQGSGKGFPDRTLIIPSEMLRDRHSNNVVFIEFKTPHGKLSEMQKEWRSWMRQHGVGHWVIDDIDFFKSALCSMVDRIYTEEILK